ncbi:DUF234 domain-containing protein [Haloferax larsenii]|uniref:DUF234 domain-containing protein n=1 Tax=Haloferax larsenii TaxID=302484 RepID=UPI0031395A8C
MRFSFPVPCSRVGRWWYSEEEIDVVWLNSQTNTHLGECKRTNSPVSRSLLDKLEVTEPEVRWQGPRPRRRICTFLTGVSVEIIGV